MSDNQPQLAPIALFVYNRPEHTRRTLEALNRNEGSARSPLFIFSDGLPLSATEHEQRRLNDVRRLIREKPWCGKVEIRESKVNKGLAQSICDGIDNVLETFDRLIVLEDDLETSPGFLTYMNDALKVYEDQEQVFQISGFMVKNRPWASETGFLRVSSSWGWATWQRAWKYYRSDVVSLLKEVEQKGISEFDLDGCSFHFEELKRNVSGELNTWAIRWYASIFLAGGLCLYPRKSLVRNHGFDGSGVHCYDDKARSHREMSLAKNILVSQQAPTENPHYLKALQTYYKRVLQLWTGTRFRDRFRRRILRIVKVDT
ncbi:hypothetical protein ACFL1V_02460 [Pseudomonadota bacterium]